MIPVTVPSRPRVMHPPRVVRRTDPQPVTQCELCRAQHPAWLLSHGVCDRCRYDPNDYGEITHFA